MELGPPDPTMSENGEDDFSPKLGEDKMPLKMHQWWMHREIEKETAAGDREVVPELEDYPRMVGPGIRLEKSSDRLGMFFFPFTICALGLKRIIGVDE